MILKKYIYGQFIFLFLGIASFLCYIGTGSYISMIVTGLAIFIGILFPNFAVSEVNRYLYALKQGNIKKFEDNLHNLVSHPKRWIIQLPYEATIGLYEYLSGDKEKGRIRLESICKKCEQKHYAGTLVYHKRLLSNLALFSLVEGNKEKAGYYMKKLESLLPKESKVLVVGNRKSVNYIAAFIKEALLFEKDQTQEHLMQLDLLLENEIDFYMRLYGLMYLAQSYEAFDKEKAVSYYETIIKYGNELELVREAVSKKKELVK